MEIALKISSSTFNPIQLTFLRFVIGSLILLVPAFKGLKKRSCKLKARDWAFFSLTGFICVIVSMVLFQLAILYAQANTVAVLFSCNSIFVVLFAFFMLHEKINRYTAISVIISFIGIIVIMNPLHMSASAAGIILSLLAAITFAFYGVIGRTRSEKYGGVALTCFSFITGSIEMFILILITKIHSVSLLLTQSGLKTFADIPILSGINLHTLPALIYIGIFVTGLGYAFYFIAIEVTSATTASLVFFIKPALAPILALIILGEPIKSTMIVGILLILFGSLITFVPNMKRSNNTVSVNNESEA